MLLSCYPNNFFFFWKIHKKFKNPPLTTGNESKMKWYIHIYSQVSWSPCNFYPEGLQKVVRRPLILFNTFLLLVPNTFLLLLLLLVLVLNPRCRLNLRSEHHLCIRPDAGIVTPWLSSKVKRCKVHLCFNLDALVLPHLHVPQQTHAPRLRDVWGRSAGRLPGAWQLPAGPAGGSSNPAGKPGRGSVRRGNGDVDYSAHLPIQPANPVHIAFQLVL